MLQNWLAPVPSEVLKIRHQASSTQFGQNVLIHDTTGLPEMQQVQIALLGIDATESDQARRFLYPLSFPFGQLKIADLGNARNNDPSFVIPIIEELLRSGIFPIIIGKSPELIPAQFQAYQNINSAVNLAVVDETLAYRPTTERPAYYLNSIFRPKNHLFNFVQIGYQTHLTDLPALEYLAEHHYDALRLGNARNRPESMEPFIRDADLLCFNLASLKQAEAPSIEQPTPSGFFSEEACQISRYAGMSDKLTSIGFYGFRFGYDQNHQTAQVLSQLVWYFISGFYHRKQDFPVTTDGLVEYIVQFKAIDQPVTFWKSNKSGRWWMQIPADTQKQLQRHRLVPCSYEDYQKACVDDIPERLLAAYRRFS